MKFFTKLFIVILLTIRVAAISQTTNDITGYTRVAGENESFQIEGYADVAYGANGIYALKLNVTGLIAFNNAIFGDPVPGVAKSGYIKKRDGNQVIQQSAAAINNSNIGQSQIQALQSMLVNVAASSAQNLVNNNVSNQNANAALTTVLGALGQQQSLQQIATSLATEQAQLLVNKLGSDQANALLTGLISSNGQQQIQLVRNLIVDVGKENAQAMVSKLLGNAGEQQFQAAVALVNSANQGVSSAAPNGGIFFPNGLTANYYNDLNGMGTGVAGTVTLTESSIDYDWGVGPPNGSVPPDNFMAKWEGSLVIPISGDYTIYAVADDGVQVLLNGNAIINAWQDQGPTEYLGNVSLSAGASNQFAVYYYERGGGALIRVYISGPGIAKQIIR